MKTLFDKAAWMCSKRITITYSTSFSLAVKMLSPKIQGAIYSIYGFVRQADEIVDSFHDYNPIALFEEYEQDLENALQKGFSLNPILHAFQNVVHKYGIDRDLIDAFMNSMRADLYKRNYKSFSNYEQYIYGSADVVGLMCLKVFVNGKPEEYENLKYPAQKLGSAFQKVNFLRDLKQDSEFLNRSYFPHLAFDDLNRTTKAEIIEEIENDFAEAFKGIRQLPMVSKFGVYTAYVYYCKLLKKLKTANVEEIKSKRIRINQVSKMALLFTSFINYKLRLV